jgi:hypothetical protein
MIGVGDLVENCWQREIRFLSRSFKKSFSAFTFSLDKKNDGFGVMPEFWVAIEKISGNDKRSVPSELTNQVINRSFAVQKMMAS